MMAAAYKYHGCMSNVPRTYENTFATVKRSSNLVCGRPVGRSVGSFTGLLCGMFAIFFWKMRPENTHTLNWLLIPNAHAK